MNDCSVLLRDDSAVPGGHFQSVVRFCILVEELCCCDISSFAVNLKVLQIIIFESRQKEMRTERTVNNTGLQQKKGTGFSDCFL